MTGPLPDVWFTRDFPVLIEIARSIDPNPGGRVSVDQLRQRLDLTETETRSALQALKVKGLIEGNDSPEFGLLDVSWISADAYKMTGLHPGDDDVAALVAALDAAAETSDDEAETGRLRRLAAGFRDLTGDVAKRVLAAYLAAHIPS